MKILFILIATLTLSQTILTAPTNENDANDQGEDSIITKRHIFRNFGQGLLNGGNTGNGVNGGNGGIGQPGQNVFGSGLNTNRPILSNLFSNGLFPGLFSGQGNAGINQQQGVGGLFSGFHLPNYPILTALGNGNLIGQHGSAGFGPVGITSYSGLGAGNQQGFATPLQGIGGLAPAHSLTVLARQGLDGYEYKPEENQMYTNNFGHQNGYNNGFPIGYGQMPSGFGATGYPNY